LSTVLFTAILLFYIALYVGCLSPLYAKDVLLHTFVIFVVVRKQI